MSNSLLAAALSSITNRLVITYDDYSKGVGGRVPTSNEEGRFYVFIKGFSVTTMVEVYPSDEIHQLKAKIEDKLCISLENYELKLIGGGGDGSGSEVNYPSPSTMFIHPDSLAPSYDYDFTQIDDKVSYHGTARDNCKLISEVGFTHNGDNYKDVFQNRVNPNDLVKVSKEKLELVNIGFHQKTMICVLMWLLVNFGRSR
ncbi:hypothetical protein C1646_672113 [Rhizophagus diaphanus]|nr:hypothetical protein C1646_672113 [Rhizophagus diaphanus] [Rhizophagus sp. MUCL 43196]